MVLCKMSRYLGIPVLLSTVLMSSLVLAQVAANPAAPGNAPAAQQPAATRPPLQVAERAESLAQAPAPTLGPAAANEHPLMPTLRWAYDGIGNIEKNS